MDSRLLGRRLAAISGASAIIAMGAMTAACAKEEKAPETTTTTTTTTTTATTPATTGAGAPPAPSEKSINPTGGNLFTPPVVAPAAPTVPPGQHPGIGGIP
jgi:type IV secretory pathway VirB10-like protein